MDFFLDKQDTHWKDFMRQRKNSLTNRNINEISKILHLTEEEKQNLEENSKIVKIRLTPHLLKLIKETQEKWIFALKRQFLNVYKTIDEIPKEQWDNTQNIEENLPVKNAQNKYNNSRIITRLTWSCTSFCWFCYEAIRTLKGNWTSHLNFNDFKKLCNYIEENPQIDEIIFSWWEPLLLTNKILEKYFKEVRNIKRETPLLIRIHTRELTFNPYRFDKDFINLCNKYQINGIGLHVTHPSEFTSIFKEKVKKLKEKNPYINLHLNTPLLKGINDKYDTLKKLIIEARNLWIEPRYIYHTMPETPSKETFYVPIQKAIKLLEKFSINISSSMRPRFVIAPNDWKFEPSLYWNRNFEYINKWTGIRYSNRKWEEKEYNDPT